MSDGIWSAASGAIGQVTALDVAAENVANASTPAFRGSRAVFREVLTQTMSKRSGGFDLKYAVAATPATDMSQGAMLVTQRPLDVAVRGDGFLAVKTAQGERYTRSGSLRVGSDGSLVTANGDPILGVDRKPVRVPVDPDITIEPDGTVRSAGEPAGQVLLVEFDNPKAMTAEGHYLLRADAPAGKPRLSTSTLEPGMLEASNVSPVRGMIDIVNATRAFDICEKSVESFRDADRRAADIMSVK
ncbi:MAG TPA: flagellar hook basal-body protein [Polyangiaceae bacterium]|jgi:flagellar basal body rod protein FlgG